MALSVGLVGCGAWGALYLRDLIALGAEVHVVGRSEATRARAKAGGARSVVPAIEALPPVSGVFVVTPATAHAACIRALLPRQIPVYCEKPLVPDVAEAEAVVREAGPHLHGLHVWRYHAGIEALRDLVRSGDLGPLQGVRLLRLGWGNRHRDIDSVWVLAPHELSIVQELLGELPPARCAVAERGGGGMTGLDAMLGAQPWVRFTCSSLSPQHQRQARLIFRDGTATLDGAYADHVAVVRQADPHDTAAPAIEKRPIATELPLLRELRAVLGHLAGGPAPKGSAAEAATVVRRIHELRAMAGGLT